MSEEARMAAIDAPTIAQQAARIAELEGTITKLMTSSLSLVGELECELTAARAVVGYANDYLKRSGRCFFCGFGRKLSGEEFHGTGCLLHAYNHVVAKGTNNADRPD